ncbi:hypothetical protein DFQ28_007027 [Apophysomyces sp. BC1034]|nr:hypothetical protein DFQ30_006652 [Apophysomyces sp. BC1015]KAG0176643.1 hypothetical protein DFQ29_005853 [Apophysomyces sp. BC1021]KAG0186990.1 hypothetical protein DFQ28_007027 [Apophysomyces sp. BC1034]
MIAQLRALSSLPVIRAPLAGRSFVVSQRCMSTDAPAKEGTPVRNIEQETLSLLQETVMNDKTKPATGQARYQKLQRVGNTYHPQDLDDAHHQEVMRQRRRTPERRTEDPFDALGLNPLHEYKNFRLLSEFVSDIGKILPREQTGLTAKNQRKLAQAIKRARAMGLMSCTSKEHVTYLKH